MARARRDEVDQEIRVEDEALGEDDEAAHERRRLAHLQQQGQGQETVAALAAAGGRQDGCACLEEGEEVHALVLGLLEERMDPAVVAPHCIG